MFIDQSTHSRRSHFAIRCVHQNCCLRFFGAALASTANAQTVTLPKDEAPHKDLVEWYYFVGHLEGG